jgi:signal transduction histidine kinase
VLILNQSTAVRPWPHALMAGIREGTSGDPSGPVSFYIENLDLARFQGPSYATTLQDFLVSKYRDHPIGAVVVIGANTLRLALDLRAALWPKVPLVFTGVDEDTAARPLPAGVTGVTMRMKLADMVHTAQTVVPDARRFVLVGDPFDSQLYFQHFGAEMQQFSPLYTFIDDLGLPVDEVERRVALLPADSAILYMGSNSPDGIPSLDLLRRLSLLARGPIIVGSETFLGTGALGGLVQMPELIGRDTGKLVLRVLDGEDASGIAVKSGDTLKPIFDWRQLQRWGISSARLPPGSEVRFRDPNAWERYRWAILTIGGILLLQAASITGLIYERRRRHAAEIAAHERLLELAHVNRYALAGEMSASIAHELNQPLTAILANTEAAERMLASTSPNMAEIKQILADIRRDDRRAGQVIRSLREFLQKDLIEPQDIDLNDTVSEMFEFLSARANARNVLLTANHCPQRLTVRGNHVQIQQVILNLVLNSMDASTAMQGERSRKVAITGRTTRLEPGVAEVSIADGGPGIPADKLEQVFQPFYTTKERGMGLGLTIARTIIEAHGGRIWAENQLSGGAIVRFTLPLEESPTAVN